MDFKARSSGVRSQTEVPAVIIFFFLPITDWITKTVSARRDKSNPDNPVDRYECLDLHVNDDDLVALALSLTPTASANTTSVEPVNTMSRHLFICGVCDNKSSH